MKIRIRGNSVRYRLTKSEVSHLCQQGFILSQTPFPSNIFACKIVVVEEGEQMTIDYLRDTILLKIPHSLIEGWEQNNKVGFYQSIDIGKPRSIDIILEKDFNCLEDRGEDESDNYPNPKLKNQQ